MVTSAEALPLRTAGHAEAYIITIMVMADGRTAGTITGRAEAAYITITTIDRTTHIITTDHGVIITGTMAITGHGDITGIQITTGDGQQQVS